MRYDRTVIGYHGCEAGVAQRLLAGARFRSSRNDFDWLGSGVYFWEYGPERALEFAATQLRRRGRRARPAVVGAIIQLGSELQRQTHVQVAVRNADCTLGVFRPTLCAMRKPPRNRARAARRLTANERADARALAELRAMSPRALMQTLVDAGIYTPTFALTRKYRSEPVSPSPRGRRSRAPAGNGRTRPGSP